MFLRCPAPPQYFADVVEAESWLGDRRPLLSSEDHGKDEGSAEALLQRHLRLERELSEYAPELQRLGEQAQSAALQAPLTVSHSESQRYRPLPQPSPSRVTAKSP